MKDYYGLHRWNSRRTLLKGTQQVFWRNSREIRATICSSRDGGIAFSVTPDPIENNPNQNDQEYTGQSKTKRDQDHDSVRVMAACLQYVSVSKSGKHHKQ
jgi:hypothetical protein